MTVVHDNGYAPMIEVYNKPMRFNLIGLEIYALQFDWLSFTRFNLIDWEICTVQVDWLYKMDAFWFGNFVYIILKEWKNWANIMLTNNTRLGYLFRTNGWLTICIMERLKSSLLRKYNFATKRKRKNVFLFTDSIW